MSRPYAPCSRWVTDAWCSKPRVPSAEPKTQAMLEEVRDTWIGVIRPIEGHLQCFLIVDRSNCRWLLVFVQLPNGIEVAPVYVALGMKEAMSWESWAIYWACLPFYHVSLCSLYSSLRTFNSIHLNYIALALHLNSPKPKPPNIYYNVGNILGTSSSRQPMLDRDSCSWCESLQGMCLEIWYLSLYISLSIYQSTSNNSSSCPTRTNHISLHISSAIQNHLSYTQ